MTPEKRKCEYSFIEYKFFHHYNPRKIIGINKFERCAVADGMVKGKPHKACALSCHAFERGVVAFYIVTLLS
jgi:hypothetical protein